MTSPDSDGGGTAVPEPSPAAEPAPPSPPPSPPASRLAASPIARTVWLGLGLSFVLLGFVGIFLPVLPTTPFLILAAACFSRSSQRLEAWLLGHPRFGPSLRDWRLRGAIPLRAKFLALLGCSFGFALFLAGGDPSPPLIVAVALLMLGGLAYVASRPS